MHCGEAEVASEGKGMQQVRSVPPFASSPSGSKTESTITRHGASSQEQVGRQPPWRSDATSHLQSKLVEFVAPGITALHQVQPKMRPIPWIPPYFVPHSQYHLSAYPNALLIPDGRSHAPDLSAGSRGLGSSRLR